MVLTLFSSMEKALRQRTQIMNLIVLKKCQFYRHFMTSFTDQP